MVSARTIAKATGLGLSVLAVGFVVSRVLTLSEGLDLTVLSTIAPYLLLLSVAYASFSLLLALAWRNILEFLGVDMGKSQSIAVYGMSQLAKYIPGNIFQFVGRQAIGYQQGIASGPLAKSVIWELALLVGAGAIFALTLALLWSWDAPWILYIAGTLLAAGAIAWMAARLFSVSISNAFFQHLIFLFLTGVVFVIVVVLIQPGEVNSFRMLLIVAYAFIGAWLVGLLTPGAPAGIGIREYVLILVLGHAIGESTLLLATILSRFITAFGDVLLFAFASILSKSNSNQ